MDIIGDWQSGKTLAASNGFMLEKGVATNVTFSFPGHQEKVKAHKYVLISRSHVFFTMFRSGLQEDDEEIEIQDIEPAVFDEFLRYLYCEELGIEESNVLRLLHCADKYRVKTLRESCLHYLSVNLRETTVALILEQALLYSEDILIAKCLDVFSRIGLESLRHHHIPKNALETILDCESIFGSRSPVEIFHACNTWAYDECVKRSLHPNARNKRDMLGDLILKIPFHSMTNEEFATHVSPVGLLTLDEEVQIFRFLGSQNNIPPYIRAKNIYPVAVKLPTEVNVSTTQPSGFWMDIKCRRKFSLVGFSFCTIADITLRINNTWQDFSVSRSGVNTYMVEPTSLENHLIISDGWYPTRRQRMGVPFSVTCRDGQVEFTGECYITNQIPFESILVSFT